MLVPMAGKQGGSPVRIQETQSASHTIHEQNSVTLGQMCEDGHGEKSDKRTQNSCTKRPENPAIQKLNPFGHIGVGKLIQTSIQNADMSKALLTASKSYNCVNITAGLKYSYSIGHGSSPVNHFHAK